MTPEQTLDWLAEQHKSQCNEDRPVQEWIRSMKSMLPAPVQEPYGYVSTHTNGLMHFNKTFHGVYTDTATEIVAVYTTPLATPVVQREAIKELADQYARECVEFSKAIQDGAHSMSPIAVKSGDTRLALHTAIDALATPPAAHPAVPLTDSIFVPLKILEAAEASLGSFCSDHGWSDMDMQNMDNLSAYIARHKANRSITKGQP
jgi:hypothetical protein